MNLLNDIEITPVAEAAWADLSVKLIRHLLERGVKPEDIPDESAVLLSDGWLRIYIEVKKANAVAMLDIPPSSWRWRPKPPLN